MNINYQLHFFLNRFRNLLSRARQKFVFPAFVYLDPRKNFFETDDQWAHKLFYQAQPQKQIFYLIEWFHRFRLLNGNSLFLIEG